MHRRTRKRNQNRSHGVVVSHPLSMREALGSIPSVSIRAIICFPVRLRPHCVSVCQKPSLLVPIPCGNQSRNASCGEKSFRPRGPACPGGLFSLPQSYNRTPRRRFFGLARVQISYAETYQGHVVLWYHTRSACGRPWVQSPACPLLIVYAWSSSSLAMQSGVA